MVYEETKQYQVSLCGLRNQVDAVYILQPAKIPSLYNAFLACLDLFSEINLLAALAHCNPTSQHYL